jgi:deazaflavin-dependent oxidoreductase (nitroreductase family)
VTGDRANVRSGATKSYRSSRARRFGDAITSVLIRAGIVPHSYLLTTKGRRTGKRRTTPVTVVEHDDRQWLVAPYGTVGWVHNARAAGEVALSRRGRPTNYRIREAGAGEAAPVLKAYVAIARPTRPYFQAHHDAPVAEFALETDRHPVFQLLETRGDST